MIARYNHLAAELEARQKAHSELIRPLKVGCNSAVLVSHFHYEITTICSACQTRDSKAATDDVNNIVLPPTRSYGTFAFRYYAAITEMVSVPPSLDGVVPPGFCLFLVFRESIRLKKRQKTVDTCDECQAFLRPLFSPKLTKYCNLIP